MNPDISPLRSFLDLEIIRSEFADVVQVEYDFGSNSNEHKIRFETMLGQFHLNGRIDRVDRLKSDNKYIIYDYKLSAKNGTQKLINARKSFQFPVYGFAVSQLLGLVGGCIYYTLKLKQETLTDHLSDFWGEQEIIKKYSKSLRRGLKAENISEFTNKIETVPDLLGHSVNRIASGDFRLNETAHDYRKGFECSPYCSLASTCRKDEQRIEILSKISDSGEE